MKKIQGDKIARLYDSGLSVSQISEHLGISPAKIRYSMQKQLIPFRSHSTASKLLHLTKFGRKQFQVKKILSSEDEKLRIAGIMLYWGEGTKSGNSVVFSNSDPDMVNLFLKFLRQICGVDEGRLRMLLHIYSDHNEDQLKAFWSNQTNISLKQFSKTYIHQEKKGNYKKISKYGTASLRYSDKELLNIINDWISKFRLPI